MTELDPELLEWVRDFIEEKERVTVDDVRREFFPDEMGAPYPYLDRLVADRVIEYRARQQVYEWAYRAKPRPKTEPVPEPKPKVEPVPEPKAEPVKVWRPPARTFADGEVHELTWSEIHERFGFGDFRGFRNWLRGHARRRSPMQLSIQQTETGVRFCMGLPPLKWMAPGKGGWRRQPGHPEISTRNVHKDCTHPHTPDERLKCRKRKAG
ncbi:hypothetical protein ACIHFB_06805 [Streptomyces sp. NPDC051963]|uniref:hypothetical protein n=1 Tax=Streptomyces sp. NPDC051963 TaxID=3365678 RepID=UPI0037D1C502